MSPGSDYDDCCRPALDGQAWPTTAEALMRSRYTAFARGNEDHLFRTWHAKTRPADIGLDTDTTWLGLKIIGTTGGSESEETGTVHFRATCRDHIGEHILEENSSFVRRAGRWVYLDAID
ncbi:YchJ family protein [Brevibacterium sp. UCMA 11754]|uniref:YchJ family protein n=1 Tax=Brevibacterium sp. UCMA 11754 TaxID=2749198 RepID=UPI001F449409|nr:YchJ family metal-binding protein [Brevibacterium sp. UCMA 11754]MCF2571972.1 zinc chelation protein SecC [Brevibacterium sp. UCMA 11754]